MAATCCEDVGKFILFTVTLAARLYTNKRSFCVCSSSG